MGNWFKIVLKWVFLVAGVPVLAGACLYLTGIYTFPISEPIWMNLVGLFFIIFVITYEILIIKYLRRLRGFSKKGF